MVLDQQEIIRKSVFLSLRLEPKTIFISRSSQYIKIDSDPIKKIETVSSLNLYDLYKEILNDPANIEMHDSATAVKTRLKKELKRRNENKMVSTLLLLEG